MSEPNEQKVKELAYVQLENYYSIMESDRGRRLTTRNWFIIIWLAILVVLGSRETQLPLNASITLVAVPTVLFWMFEAAYQMGGSINRERVMRLESFIRDGDFSKEIPKDLMLVTGWAAVSLPKKYRHFVRTLLFAEMLVFFYLFILVASILFLVVLQQ